MYKNTDKIGLLFVCLGNICRSPAGEEIMRQIVIRNKREKDFFIDSCGIGGWHIGQLPDKRMRMAGSKQGYNFTHHARQFDKEDFANFDYILCMDNENIFSLQSKDQKGEYSKKIILLSNYLTKYPNQKEIPDPYYGEEKDFFFVIELLENACENLFNKKFKI